MTEKDLNKLYMLKKEQEILDKELDELRADTLYRSPAYSQAKSKGKQVDKIPKHIAKLIDKENTLIDKCKETEKEIQKIEKFLESIGDPEVRLIFRLRHIDLQTWYEIALELTITDDKGKIVKQYSERTIIRKYHKYLKKCAENA